MFGERGFLAPVGFVEEREDGSSACRVCGRAFDHVEGAREHVEGLARMGALLDHLRIHAPQVMGAQPETQASGDAGQEVFRRRPWLEALLSHLGWL